MQNVKFLLLAVIASFVATAATSVTAVSAQDNVTGSSMTGGNYTESSGNMSDASESGSGNVSGLLGGGA